MKSRIHRIEIQNFKAFRDFSLDIEGRHLLLYGPNGSGKSSIYWTFYTFLQSARKHPQHAIAKYFDPTEPQNLLNIYEDSTARPGEIALTLRDTAIRNDTTYRISLADHDTYKRPAILKGGLASDFITYRFFFGFSHFSNSEKFDLWPLFEKEILPFCVSIGGKAPLDIWEAIKSGNPNPARLPGAAGANAYSSFKNKTGIFAEMLPGIVDSISNEAQLFYDKHFSPDDSAKLTLKLGVTTPPSAIGSNQNNFQFTRPIIEFGIQIDGKTIHRPQTFLNEAKLTQLALSVRFAASLVNLHESDLKLLVLDDLLVSLDMSNRMQVVEILLSEQFDNYQKLILTHDLGFFRDFQSLIGDDPSAWCVRTLKGNASAGITAEASEDPLKKARQYISGHDLEEAAVQLRKAAEETAQRYRRFAMGETPRPGQFHSLSEDLRAARKHLEQQLPMTLYKQVIAGTPEAYRDKLVCVSDADLDADTSLDAATRGKLKTQRRRLRQFLSNTAWQQAKAMQTIDAVIRMKDRVLNPTAHWGEAPLYQAELDKALKLVNRLEQVLIP